jgi:hypothetical protein
MAANLRAAKWLNVYRAGLNLEGEAGGFLLVPEVMPLEMFIKKMEFENRYATDPELRDDPLLASRSDS